MVKVKICGITNQKDLNTVLDAGADAVGFVVGVPQSPRNLSLKKAKEIMNMVPVFVSKVAVTVFYSLDQIFKINKELRPNFLQIHGDGIKNRPEMYQNIGNENIIRALRLNKQIQGIIKESKDFSTILIDTYVMGKHGGTGVKNDFSMCKEIKEAIHPKPLILAGGLTPDNVAEAISTVHPYAVDVSSGVEKRPGVKDSKKVFQFISIVRRLQA
jgi:phosphoribosylanthranilate isomerase